MRIDSNFLQVAMIVAVLGGCGPAAEKYVPVSGLVTIDGQPVKKAKVQTVAFMPIDPDKVHFPAAEIGPDGRYTLETIGQSGAPLGKYKVVVSITDDPAAFANPWGSDGQLRKVEYQINPKYTSKETSDLEVEIVVNPKEGQYDLKLTR